MSSEGASEGNRGLDRSGEVPKGMKSSVDQS